MAMSLFSVTLTILHILMAAPDVALTEASIGAFLSTIFLLMCLPMISPLVKAEKRKMTSYIVIFVLICFFSIMIAIHLPIYGDIDNPAYKHLGSYYLANTIKDTGIISTVASILASYRGFDTLGETLVITIAGIIFYNLTKSDEATVIKVNINKNDKSYLNIVGFKMLFPIMLLFIFYIQVFGEISPGGGFQAGALMASIMLFYIWLTENIDFDQLKEKLFNLSIVGFLIYYLTGFACMLMGGKYLEYNAFKLSSHALGVFVIEIGVFITVFSVMLLIAIILMEKILMIKHKKGKL
jgi:multicomponent Na+:H+ antiporter subunit B